MSAIIPWKKQNENTPANDEIIEDAELIEDEEESSTKSLAKVEEKKGLASVKKKNDIVIRKGNNIVQIKAKEIIIAGERHKVDPYQLIRMIRRVTQNIGEYKLTEDVYSAVITGALRKARGDLVGILEKDFNIHWQIGDDGTSIFYQ
jgi:hypothetical protein